MSATFTFRPDTHEYYNKQGARVLSVTQILENVGLVDYSHVPEPILNRKADLGTAVHAAAHYLDDGDLRLDSVAAEVSPYLAGWMKFKNETKFRVESAETQGIAEVDGMQYGYTYDRKGLLFQKRVILDLKCTVNVERSWGPQLAGYELAERMASGEAPRNRVAVHLKPNGDYALVVLNDTKDYQIFKAALLLETWKLSKGKKHGHNGNGNH